MASEYLKWKYRDVKPDEPPPPLTGRERVKNWLHYHIIYIVAVAVVIGVAGSMVWNALGIGKVKPDYIFAYVGKNPLPEDTVSALERELAALGEDLNGDGRSVVELRSYVSGSGDSDTAAGYGTAAAVTLTADITRSESAFFITDDPLALQARYQILAAPGGGLPEEDDYSWEGKAYRWSDCPVLASLPLGDYLQEVNGTAVGGASQGVLAPLYIGIRGYSDPPQTPLRRGYETMWKTITEGAVTSP